MGGLPSHVCQATTHIQNPPGVHLVDDRLRLIDQDLFAAVGAASSLRPSCKDIIMERDIMPRGASQPLRAT